MFDVLVYLYENYWRPDACPEPKQLKRKLSAVGFEAEEIHDALRWLDGLASSAESLGFITFLESAGVLPAPMREMVLDRAMAVGNGPMDLEDLKIIVLMVFWSLGEEPDALILDELFVDSEDRVIH
jgi:Smg protein